MRPTPREPLRRVLLFGAGKIAYPLLDGVDIDVQVLSLAPAADLIMQGRCPMLLEELFLRLGADLRPTELSFLGLKLRESLTFIGGVDPQFDLPHHRRELILESTHLPVSDLVHVDHRTVDHPQSKSSGGNGVVLRCPAVGVSLLTAQLLLGEHVRHLAHLLICSSRNRPKAYSRMLISHAAARLHDRGWPGRQRSVPADSVQSRMEKLVSVFTLPIPTMSAYDPPTDGEGRLDPLGLAPIADRIADSYARVVRARMRRVRFLSVISLGSLVVEALDGVEPKYPGDSAELAFERFVVEALARSPIQYAAIDTGIPGITKAHQAVLAHQRLDARGYLKSPRVFGFHGVYRPLATGLGLVDARGGLLPAGRALVRALEGDLRLPGLLDRSPNTLGDGFVSWLVTETASTLRKGQNTFAVGNLAYLPTLIALASPSQIGVRERVALRSALGQPTPGLHTADDEAFTETLEQIGATVWEDGTTEPQIVAHLAQHGTPALVARMHALEAYEAFAADLMWAFDTFRFVSAKSQHGIAGEAAIAQAVGITIPAALLANRYRAVVTCLQDAALHGVDTALTTYFADAFVAFAQPLTPQQLMESILARHVTVQGNKPPAGKRSWFEEIGKQVAVRPLFALHEEPELRNDRFLHPYRFVALTGFLGDLHG